MCRKSFSCDVTKGNRYLLYVSDNTPSLLMQQRINWPFLIRSSPADETHSVLLTGPNFTLNSLFIPWKHTYSQTALSFFSIFPSVRMNPNHRWPHAATILLLPTPGFELKQQTDKNVTPPSSCSSVWTIYPSCAVQGAHLDSSSSHPLLSGWLKRDGGVLLGAGMLGIPRAPLLAPS